jgi:uncharacterized protein Usg
MIILKRKELVLVGIIYYMPDYKSLLNEFYCQFDDIVPDIPRVHEFLYYWKKNIEAPIKEVKVSIAMISFKNFLLNEIIHYDYDRPNPTENISHFNIVRKKDNKVVGKASTPASARKAMNRHDDNYGSYAHKIIPVYNKE